MINFSPLISPVDTNSLDYWQFNVLKILHKCMYTMSCLELKRKYVLYDIAKNRQTIHKKLDV